MIAEYVSALRGFSRDVRLYLATTALLGFTVFGGVYPVLFNLYLLRLGYGPDFVGLIGSVVGLTFALSSLPAGLVSSRWGGRRAMIAGLGVAVLGLIALPLAEIVPLALRSTCLVTVTFVRAMGFALYWVNARPFVMSATRAEERGHVYSAQAVVFPLTGFAGSLLAGVMPASFARLLGVSTDHPAPYRYPLWAVSLLLLPGLAALRSIREFGPSPRRDRTSGWDWAPLKLIVLLATCILLQGAGQGVASAFFTVYLDDHLEVPTATIGSISAVTQLLSALAALSTPALAKRWGNGRVFVWGSLGAVLGLLPLALVPHWSAAALGYLAVMALGGAAFPAINVYQMELVPLAWRTTMSGATAMASGLSWSGAAFFGGQAVALWGYRPFFLSGAALTLIGALLFAACFAIPRGDPAGASERPGRDG